MRSASDTSFIFNCIWLGWPFPVPDLAHLSGGCFLVSFAGAFFPLLEPPLPFLWSSSKWSTSCYNIVMISACFSLIAVCLAFISLSWVENSVNYVSFSFKDSPCVTCFLCHIEVIRLKFSAISFEFCLALSIFKLTARISLVTSLCSFWCSFQPFFILCLILSSPC